jgi:hypothetical protein
MLNQPHAFTGEPAWLLGRRYDFLAPNPEANSSLASLSAAERNDLQSSESKDEATSHTSDRNHAAFMLDFSSRIRIT